MKAMVLHQPGPIESSPLVLEDWAEPVAAAGEVRVKVRCCGVCRTDLHIVENELMPPMLPLIVGHQTVGVVDQVGEGCARLKMGERVGIAWLRQTDGTCRFCTSGRENLCPSSRYSGYHAHGGYAEFAVVPEAFAYAIPEQFDDVSAAPLLCAGIIGYRSMKRCYLRDGSRVALFGFGSSAHIVLQLAVKRGCVVYVVSRSEGHRKLALELGAAWAGADAGKIPEKVESAILFAPVGKLVPAALSVLDRGGALAIADIRMSPIPELDYEKSIFYERDLHSVTANTRADGRELLREAARLGVRAHVQVYPLEEANRALVDLKQGRVEGTAVLEV